MGKTAQSFQETAVIDVGSNSVRLVIYAVKNGVFRTLVNEKSMAGLGRDLHTTGRLSQKGVDQALRILKRFSMILQMRGSDLASAFATAAVRNAEDGKAFIKRVNQETGLVLKCLSGGEEARYAAFGVLLGSPEAEGIAGDLGGSSLELARLKDQKVSMGVSLELGPLSVPFSQDVTKHTAEHKALITKALKQADPLFKKAGKSSVFYAVGGAWRALAHIDMHRRGYPLPILQGYRFSGEGIKALSSWIETRQAEDLARIPGVSRRRSPYLSWACYLLLNLFKCGMFSSAVISAYGVREGALYKNFHKEGEGITTDHLTIFSDLLVEEGRAFGQALASWISPVFKNYPSVFEKTRADTLYNMAARLHDFGIKYHPDFRVLATATEILQAPLPSLSHEERVFLALALAERHGGGDIFPTEARALLSEGGCQEARVLGAVLRLGADLAAHTPGVLSSFVLKLKDENLSFQVKNDNKNIPLPDKFETRLKHAAMLFKSEAI